MANDILALRGEIAILEVAKIKKILENFSLNPVFNAVDSLCETFFFVSKFIGRFGKALRQGGCVESSRLRVHAVCEPCL